MNQQSLKHNRQMLIELTKSQKIDKYRPQKLIQKITQQVLLKIQEIMRDFQYLNIAEFLRLLMHVLKHQFDQGDQFYLMYGLFKVFKQVCRAYKTPKISFSQISTFITQKMPVTDQQVIVKQKLLPIGFEIPQQQKSKIILPSISGKVIHERKFLTQNPAFFDRFQHTNRSISQALYSPSNEMYLTIDLPSTFVRLTDKNFNQIAKIQSQQQISKKQLMITSMAWSQTEGRLGVILGNFSLSFWSKQDNYRFQVNVPLPLDNIAHPFVVIGYMESMKVWYVIDNRPVVFGLSKKNFEPMYEIKNFKMIKQKSSQKIFTLQMKYQKLLCIGFQRKVFLLSLTKRQVITQITNFKTSITSMVFSESYQALFLSNFNNYFKAYQLTEYCDLTQKGKFQGHKHQIILLGTVDKKPIVYSLEESYLMKLWDIRDLTCYQTFSVLKNVLYMHIFTVNEGVCLIGSKMYVYKWAVQKQQNKSSLFIQSKSSKQIKQTIKQKVILITSIDKNILMISNLTLKLFDYHKGSLIKLVRGLFEGQAVMSFAFLNIAKKQLFISNEQGHFKVLQTQSFTRIYEFKYLQKPLLMHYSQKQDLISIGVQSQIHIMQWKRQQQFDLKRKIFNQKQSIKICKIYPIHDLILTVYNKNDNQDNGQQNYQNLNNKINNNEYQTQNHKNQIYFYSFQRGKVIGYINDQNIVDFQIHQKKNVLVVLLSNYIKIYTFTKYITSISFNLLYQIKLWSGDSFKSSFLYQFNSYLQTFNQNIHSNHLLIFQNSIVTVSNFSCLFSSISINFQNIAPGIIQQDMTNYNPYRISVQSHVQAVSQMIPSQIINKTQQFLPIHPQYNQTKAIAKTLYCLKLGNLIGIYNNKQDLHFFDYASYKLLGVINSQLTLPKMWNLSFYDQNELQDIDFVLDYMENQQKKKKIPQIYSDNQIFSLTLNNLKSISPNKNKPTHLTIQKILQNLGKLSPEKLSTNSSNHYSLRERKLMLQKQRQQRQRLQNFIQHQEQQEQNKQRSYHNQDQQSNINEILNFFATNRNEVVKNKGIQQLQLPQVKLFERKLQSSLKNSKSLIQNVTKNIANKKLLENNSQTNNQKKINQKLRILQKREKTFSLTSQSEQIPIRMNSLRLLQASLANLSQNNPYKNGNMGRMSEKKHLLKTLQQNVRRSKLSTRNEFSRQKNSSLPVLRKFN